MYMLKKYFIYILIFSLISLVAMTGAIFLFMSQRYKSFGTGIIVILAISIFIFVGWLFYAILNGRLEKINNSPQNTSL